jgi:hypothetical protein
MEDFEPKRCLSVQVRENKFYVFLLRRKQNAVTHTHTHTHTHTLSLSVSISPSLSKHYVQKYRII